MKERSRSHWHRVGFESHQSRRRWFVSAKGTSIRPIRGGSSSGPLELTTQQIENLQVAAQLVNQVMD
jgi:hypothetical protein